MKTDEKLKELIYNIRNIRPYDDKRSILIRLDIIKELNSQLININNTVILESEDYDFIEHLFMKYKIPEGMGYRNYIQCAINEYKKKNGER